MDALDTEAMIGELFTAKTSVCARSDWLPFETLHPEERPYVRNASIRRRIEFATGRYCARTALEGLGSPAAPVLRQTNGLPVWPEGVVGSISHCEDFCASVVARSRDAAAIGFDVEAARDLEPGVASLICTRDEMTRFSSCGKRPLEEWIRICFSAKEAFYKCYFPVSLTFLEFHDAVVFFHPDDGGNYGAYSVKLRAGVPWHGRETAFAGRWYADDVRIYAGATLKPSGM